MTNIKPRDIVYGFFFGNPFEASCTTNSSDSPNGRGTTLTALQYHRDKSREVIEYNLGDEIKVKGFNDSKIFDHVVLLSGYYKGEKIIAVFNRKTKNIITFHNPDHGDIQFFEASRYSFSPQGELLCLEDNQKMRFSFFSIEDGSIIAFKTKRGTKVSKFISITLDSEEDRTIYAKYFHEGGIPYEGFFNLNNKAEFRKADHVPSSGSTGHP